jgi:molecular chaperone Hsp33
VRGGLGASDILAHMLAGFDTHVLEERDVRFECRCSRARVESAILAMGRAEMLDAIARERRAEVVCEFCAERYVLEEPELRALLA